MMIEPSYVLEASLWWLESPSPSTSMEDSSVVSKRTFSSLTITSSNEKNLLSRA